MYLKRGSFIENQGSNLILEVRVGGGLADADFVPLIGRRIKSVCFNIITGSIFCFGFFDLIKFRLVVNNLPRVESAELDVFQVVVLGKCQHLREADDGLNLDDILLFCEKDFIFGYVVQLCLADHL